MIANKKNKIKIIYFVSVLLLTLIYLIFVFTKNYSLRKNHIIINAFIYEINQGSAFMAGGETVIKYSFIVKKKNIMEELILDCPMT